MFFLVFLVILVTTVALVDVVLPLLAAARRDHAPSPPGARRTGFADAPAIEIVPAEALIEREVDTFNLQSHYGDKSYVREVLAWESFGQGWVTDVATHLGLEPRVLALDEREQRVGESGLPHDSA